MKVMMLKSTCSCRDSDAVVEPHSMSMVPLATSSIRLATDTLTQVVCRLAIASSLAMLAVTSVHRSTE